MNISDKQKILTIIEKMETPSLANYGLECSTCGEDMGLEAYDCFDDGYKEALSDLKTKIKEL